MSRQIFINLPVNDVAAATAFFTGLGFAFNPALASPDSACMILNDSTCAMLLSHKHFADFTPKPIADPTTATAALYALSVDAREDVDALADAAVAAGGTNFREPQDHGFMYGRAFTDLDGHVWEAVWMDPQADMSATE